MKYKLTKKQEQQIPKFIEKYVKLAEKPTDRKKAKQAVENLYVSAGFKKPIVIFGDNPIQTALMVAMSKLLFKDNNIELLKDNSQLRSQLRSQLNSQLNSQLDSQLDSQLRDQLNNQLHNQLDNQLHNQLHNQLNNQLDSQLHNQLSNQLDSQLSSMNNAWWLVVWWITWAGWYAYAESIGVKFDKKVLKIFTDFVTNVSFCIPYDGIVFISETPQKINWENGRLHSLTDYAVEYKNNYGLYSIHGVKFTEEQFNKSKTATIAEIMSWEDIDQRSALLRDRPIEDLLKEIKEKKLIDHSDECGGYDLYEIELEKIGKAKILSYKSWSSDKHYVKFVPLDSEKALETVASLRSQTVEELLLSNKS